MIYYDTATKTATNKASETTIPSDDIRVKDFFKPLPQGKKLDFAIDGLPLIIDIPLPTQAELDAQAIKDANNEKWNELSKFLSSLTVQRLETATDPIGFKFSADPQSISNISLEIDTMLDTDTRTWYEDWGIATVTKQELQEAKRLASEAKQAKLAELFGV